ncbi:MAG: DUF4446 family protein [Armatimonadetes bacterium]|nr:DUF4446 family protein [Armatimonadota bacterium]
MNFVSHLTQTIQDHPDAVITTALYSLLALMVVVIYLIASVISLKRRYSFLLRNEQTQDLGNVFSEHKQLLDRLTNEQRQTEGRVTRIEGRLDSTLQKVGVVRFDALDDVGGELSFAVALLDAMGNGVVLSSLYSRTDCRTYAKAVIEGRSAQLLSDEEQAALTQAQSSPLPLATREPVG